jgi:hypothetical protein
MSDMNIQVTGDGSINIDGVDYSNANQVYQDYPQLIDSPLVEFVFDREVNGGAENNQ